MGNRGVSGSDPDTGPSRTIPATKWIGPSNSHRLSLAHFEPAAPHLLGRSSSRAAELLNGDRSHQVAEGCRLFQPDSAGNGTSNARTGAVASADNVDRPGHRVCGNPRQAVFAFVWIRQQNSLGATSTKHRS